MTRYIATYELFEYSYLYNTLYTDNTLSTLYPHYIHYTLYTLYNTIYTLSTQYTLIYRWFTEDVGITPIPPSAFYTSERKELASNLARFAFCKQDVTLIEANKRFLALASKK